MKEILRMTPGPTYVTERVRKAMAMPILNPDMEETFFEKYRSTQKLLQKIYKTEEEVLILNGEGILGLEAACASLIEPGDKVLCIDNGIFGHGFIDFVKLYGGDVTVFESPYDEAVDVKKLEDFLREHHDFKLATLVHCETPAGITNPMDRICPLLKSHGILSIVDSVSAMVGEPMEMDKWKMDVVLGASQKCISAPPGLTLVGISKDARGAMKARTVPVAGFYLNLMIFDGWYENRWFPYSQPVSDIYALEEALKVILEEEEIEKRHSVLAEATRKAVTGAGLALYAKSGFASTVSTILLPEGISFSMLKDEMLEAHGILIGGAFDYLGNQVFRIGHMGENAREEKLYRTLKALHLSFTALGVEMKKPMHELFVTEMGERA
ncbi:pyridoxal-phosphate-dependent aminotransferase family protein [Proteiniclasticum sp. C24MP]|uniref:pyridoxal-phosphate-dependent aminotransferase family protein n=1 Tax=Proteiniclasticum sp. C24MP TaxID=3374101 RepID=UPI0037544966